MPGRPGGWRRIAGWTALALLALAAVYLLGPRVRVVEPTGPIELPEDLDSWLALREGAVPKLVPGTEKSIRWVDPKRRTQTDLAIVYVHDFSASRQEVAPVFDHVASALGANLYYTRLRGHGQTGRELAEAEVENWLLDVLEAYEIGKRLGRRVVVAGSGTGAAAALWLAARRADDALLALVLLSPGFAPRIEGWRLLLRPWGGTMARIVHGQTSGFEPESEAQARYWTERYPTAALLPMAGLVDLVAGITSTEVEVPVLGLVAPHDRVVDADLARARLAALPNPNNVLLLVTESEDRRQHVLAGDALSPATTDQVTARIIAFLDALPDEE